MVPIITQGRRCILKGQNCICRAELSLVLGWLASAGLPTVLCVYWGDACLAQGNVEQGTEALITSASSIQGKVLSSFFLRTRVMGLVKS